MKIETNNISYKDPTARIVKKEDGYYRYIFQEYKAEYDHLMQSGLYQDLIEEGVLIAHQEITIDSDNNIVYKLIYPTQIPFQSYPFEWSYNQWRKALLGYLRINQVALKYGMILKDATPYNFYLTKGKAVLFDTSSFIFFKENDLWIAYQQFCEEFLGPLALMHYNGQLWSRLSMTQLRGLPLNFISQQLPIKSWFNLSCLLHIHLHAKFYNKQTNNADNTNKNPQKGFTLEKIKAFFSMIESTIQSWKKAHQYSHHWSGYYENDIESTAYLQDKEATIKEWLAFTTPQSVIDLGANTGKFSFIAANYTKKVIALEYDDICVDKIAKQIEQAAIPNVSVLTGDLAEPNPALGVLHKEHQSIFERGQSDLVMGLALVHHLCIVKYLSFKQVASIFDQFSYEYAIVEFIPKTDNKVKLLLKGRTSIFQDYSEANFVAAFSIFFELVQEKKLASSTRKLFLFKKK